ncbi:helix-turn-helix domain-containing protein [Xanthomarina sp. F2636L]|uniref:helix-turn-helix domain-containing protein n=1 Tax=Xanthomarina sp. F2636L TaxID=2996018 RepID=UPI00225E6660|nr:helix-turn-helix domain-containing protein [Xanthomarina sp. F2636L]MCX7549468.1 helix-turn-helix domain-containing protein [Xanthomarina sp. F2636L]
MPFYLTNAADKLIYYNELMATKLTMVTHIQYLLKTISVWCYFLAQLYLFYKYLLKNSTDIKHNKNLSSWFIVFFGSQFLCYFGIALDQLTGLETFQDPYKYSINMLSIMLQTIGIALLFFPKLLYGIYTKKNNQKKYSHSKLSDDTKEQILEALQNYIKSDQKPYLNPKISLTAVAKDLNVSNRRLSQVINEKKGINFNDYLNSMRIEVAKQLLISEAYKKLTIETIALKSGFNSKSAFYTAFKKHIGLTPKQFINSSKKSS